VLKGFSELAEAYLRSSRRPLGSDGPLHRPEPSRGDGLHATGVFRDHLVSVGNSHDGGQDVPGKAIGVGGVTPARAREPLPVGMGGGRNRGEGATLRFVQY
jgi:hypothetical protein